ncbi:MAG TPA: transposase [Nannocystis exedens]|nr:transposase [Nannocystis exedens]
MADRFKAQLDNFRNEVGAVARFIYIDDAVNHAASRSRRVLNRLNDTPTMWLSIFNACQMAAYVSLGRIFDHTSKYNLGALVKLVESDLTVFGRAELAVRKREGSSLNPARLAEYLDAAYYPTQADVRWLKEKEKRYRAIYDRAIRPVRNKYLAHRVRIAPEEVASLYEAGLVRELWHLSASLLELHHALWQLYHNGKKPRLRPVRYSPKAMFDGERYPSGEHEHVVEEVKAFVHWLENV